MNRQQLTTKMAEVIAGLQVPVSMASEVPGMLGVAEAPARELMGLVGGWAEPEEFVTAFNRILNEEDV